jgi:hypothetical protein
MTRLEMYQFNVNRRYSAKLQEALSELAYHKYAMSSNDPMKALASFLIREGHGLTGPTGMYGITPLDSWTDNCQGYPAKDVALKFGEAILKAVPDVRILLDAPAWEINYKSYFWDIDRTLAKDPDTQKTMLKELVEDYIHITNRNKHRRWALGSVHFVEERMRKEPWVRIRAIFHFQPTQVGTVYSPIDRTLRSDWRQWVGNKERWNRVVKKAQEEIGMLDLRPT